MIFVTIKTLDSQNYKFRVPQYFTVRNLKEYIAPKVNFEVERQRLIFGGHVLDNETLLCNIDVNGKVIHLVQNFRFTNSEPNAVSYYDSSLYSHVQGISFHDTNNSFSEFIHGDIDEILHQSSITNNDGEVRYSMAMDMIRYSTQMIDRLESQARTAEVEQPESSGGQPDLSISSTQSGSLNTLMQDQHMYSNLESTTPFLQNAAVQTVGQEITVIDVTSLDQTFRTSAHNNLTTLQPAELEPPILDNINNRRLLNNLLDQLNKLNARFWPFYSQYCQFISENFQFGPTEDGAVALTIFNSVSQIMRYTSYIHETISFFRIDSNSGNVVYRGTASDILDSTPPPHTIHISPQPPSTSYQADISTAQVSTPDFMTLQSVENGITYAYHSVAVIPDCSSIENSNRNPNELITDSVQNPRTTTSLQLLSDELIDTDTDTDNDMQPSLNNSSSPGLESMSDQNVENASTYTEFSSETNNQ